MVALSSKCDHFYLQLSFTGVFYNLLKLLGCLCSDPFLATLITNRRGDIANYYNTKSQIYTVCCFSRLFCSAAEWDRLLSLLAFMDASVLHSPFQSVPGLARML
jgi:hypothetical protein